MKVKKIVAILLAVVAVVMVGTGIYFMNSSKYIFKTALSGVFDYAVDAYDKMTDSLDEFSEFKKYKLNTVNTLSMEGEEFASITGDIYVNLDEDKAYANLDSKMAGEDFLGFEGLLAEEKVYVKIKEAMEDFYYDEIEMTSTATEGLEDDEFKLLVKHAKDSILKDIEDKDLVKTSETIKLGDKNYKTTKVALNISEKRLGKIVENLLTSISNDNKAIQILQKFDKTITKDSIEELLKTFKEGSSEFSDEELFTLAFYVEGFGGLRRVEISTIEGEVDSVATNSSVTFDIYNNNSKQKTYLLTASEGEIEILTFKFEYTSKSKANIVIKASDMEISGTYEETKNSVVYNLTLLSEGETLGTVSYKDTVVSKDKEYKVEISVDVSGVMTLTSTNTLLIGEEMPSVDVSSALSFDEISEEDSNSISEYISEKLETLGLSSGDDYYDDKDYWNEDDSWEDEAYDTFYYEETSADEVEELMDSEEPTVLWFGSQKCTYCVDYAEALEEAWWDYDSYIYYIDIDDLTDSDKKILKELDSRLDVSNMGTPTTLVFQNGEIKEVKAGSMTKDELYSFLDKNGVE